MEAMMIVLLFLLGVVIGVLITCLVALRKLKKFKDTAQLYCDMYTEAAEIIRDFVVYDKDIDDLR